MRQPRLRVADVRVRRRLRGLRPAHAALAPAATGLQPTAPPRGIPCPLLQYGTFIGMPAYASDGCCDDGGPGPWQPYCQYGTDCADFTDCADCADCRMRQPPTASSPHGKGICRLLGDLLLREWRQRRLQLRVPGMRLRHRLRIARHASTAAACGSAASIASNDAAYSWQHVLGLHALAALAKVQGPSTAGAIFRTLDTAAFSAAADDAPLVTPAEFAAATARRYLAHACQLCRR